jgi:hypothetical protein
VTVRLPIERDELRVRIRQLKEDIDARQEQLDKEEAARIVDQAQTAARNRDEDLDRIEVERQKRSGELV